MKDVNAIYLSKALKREAIETPKYFGIVWDGAAHDAYPVMIYVSKKRVERAQSTGEILHFCEFPVMMREMNLGFPEDTQILWGNLLPYSDGSENDCKMLEFVLCDYKVAEYVLLNAPADSLMEQLPEEKDKKGFHQLTTYEEAREDNADFCSYISVDGEERSRFNSDVTFIFKLGYANIYDDPGKSVDSTEMLETRAQHFRDEFEKLLRKAADEVAAQKKRMEQFDTAVAQMQIEYTELCAELSTLFWSDYCSGNREFVLDYSGFASFLGKAYNAANNYDALARLQTAFDEFKARCEDYLKKVAQFDEFRDILQKYPVVVIDRFGRFKRQKALPEGRLRVHALIDIEGVTIDYERAVPWSCGRQEVGLYAGTPAGLERCLHDLAQLQKKHWSFRRLVEKYQVVK